MTALYRRYFITGRVQGVYYRGSAQRQARALGLRGWVRNLSDGRVELLVCGELQKHEELEKWLKIGPEYAKVTNIEVITESPGNPGDLPEAFEVWPTTSLSN